MMKPFFKWIDQNGFTKPRSAFGNSGNGITYSVISECLGLYNFSFSELYHVNGTLMRNQQNSYGNQSHDDYTSFAIHCIYFSDTWAARSILLTTITKLGYMKNCAYDFKKGNLKHNLKQLGRPFIVIYPAWLILMVAAAFPNKVIVFLARNLITVLAKIQKLDLSNASSVQLRWLICHAARIMGSDSAMKWLFDKISAQGTNLASIMIPYYDPEHPHLDGFERYQSDFANSLKPR